MLADKDRARIQKFLLKQGRPGRGSMTKKYLEMFPDDKRVPGLVAVNALIGSRKPTETWFTEHALARENGSRLSVEEIRDIIRRGKYLPFRKTYYDSKYSVLKTNLGRVAPATPNVKCPTRRISDGKRTVVLSFCYPKAFLKRPFFPDVITAYRK
jgi:hypothetical protein